MEKEVSITLPVAEWNIVMQALGNMPFAQVANIVPKLQGQANDQLKAADPVAE
jgi:hypothetical protein